ncbi:MAG: ASCH domain-containing protein [Planctomycetaceae bacterium]|nr:ASCH domain-containing protein [Planctomycetaceae bacterium]
MMFLDTNRIALCVQQPWAELIVRGIKQIEIRSQATTVRGPIYVYATAPLSRHPGTDRNLVKHRLTAEELPRQVVLGTVHILDCRRATSQDARQALVTGASLRQKHAWLLGEPQAFEEPIPARSAPYGIWFYPFREQG